MCVHNHRYVHVCVSVCAEIVSHYTAKTGLELAVQPQPGARHPSASASRML